MRLEEVRVYGYPYTSRPCAPASVANSDYAAADSIQGGLTQAVEVTCDEGYSVGGTLGDPV